MVVMEVMRSLLINRGNVFITNGNVFITGCLRTKVLMVHLSVQVGMSVYGPNYGYDVPSGKSLIDKAKRREIFEIIHPYIMSPEDMEEVLVMQW